MLVPSTSTHFWISSYKTFNNYDTLSREEFTFFLNAILTQAPFLARQLIKHTIIYSGKQALVLKGVQFQPMLFFCIMFTNI